MILSSCVNNEKAEKAKENNLLLPTDLLSTWKLEMPGDGESVPNQLFRRSFYKDENGDGRYEIYWIATLPDFGPTVMAAEQGELLVSTDTIFMTPTAFGSEQMGPMADDFYDTTKWYYPGDSLFGLFRNDSYGLFYIEGDTLFWKKDLNNDGEFTGQNEITRFFRENK
jgi:hypothetical protein